MGTRLGSPRKRWVVREGDANRFLPLSTEMMNFATKEAKEGKGSSRLYFAIPGNATAEPAATLPQARRAILV